MTYTESTNVKGIMLSIDFKQTFDSLSWKFLFKCLKAYNFRPKFISYNGMLYTDITATVANNGNISNWSPLTLIWKTNNVKLYFKLINRIQTIYATNFMQLSTISGLTDKKLTIRNRSWLKKNKVIWDKKYITTAKKPFCGKTGYKKEYYAWKTYLVMTVTFKLRWNQQQIWPME